VSSGTLALSAAANNIASSGTISVAAGSVLDVSGVTGGFALASAQTLEGSGSVSGAASGGPGGAALPSTLAVQLLMMSVLAAATPPTSSRRRWA
jgi:hypothetical protein